MEFISLILLVILLAIPVIYFWPIYQEKRRLELALEKIPGPKAYPIIGNTYIFFGVARKGNYLKKI